MPAINRATLLYDVQMWLPEQNILDDTQIVSLAESVISEVGDDTSNRSEVTCKTLRACALANKALGIGSNDIKREKSYLREVEYHKQNDTTFWDKYVERLADLCPLLPGGGYTIPSTSGRGFYASVSEKIVVPDLRNKVR